MRYVVLGVQANSGVTDNGSRQPTGSDCSGFIHFIALQRRAENWETKWNTLKNNWGTAATAPIQIMKSEKRKQITHG